MVVGEGYAPIIYKLYLSKSRDGIPPVGTRDIDSLISRRVPKASEKDLSSHLKDSGFHQIHKDTGDPATEAYTKDIDGTDIEVEFLTDTASRKDSSKNVVISGVVAQPLSYLTLSLNTTREFTTYSDETGFVVSPAVWIFHKGLTFKKRKSNLKKAKDLYGIWYVASQLEETSSEAVQELEDLSRTHSRWFRKFASNLSAWIESAAPIDWRGLETQDPAGALKTLQFKRLVKQLIGG